MKRGEACHIYFEPTLPGFRANTESDPIEGLAFTVESRGFLGQRELNLGDSLDIAKQVLPKLSRRLDISIRTGFEVSPEWVNRAAEYHFPETKHRIQVRQNPAQRENIWAQDYIKSGHQNGEPRVLITRLAYEGKPQNGELFAPLVASYEERGWVRSKLSWDGGDLQFSRDPRDPHRTLLFYGNTAKAYWGEELSQAEFEWVLRVEFGADEAIDLSGIASHVDYFVSILPDARTLLVSRYLRKNFRVSQEVVKQLVERYGRIPLLQELEQLYRSPEAAFGANRKRILELLEQAKSEYPNWPIFADMSAVERADAYRQAHCPEDPGQCTTGAGLERLLATEPALMREWVGFATRARAAELLPQAMLAILFSQQIETGKAKLARIEGKIAELRALGFQVLEVPRITGDVEAGIPWAGISYTNALVVDADIFMPAFGLGEWERDFFVELQKRVPRPYRIRPIYARYALLANGGAHCVAGFLRSPSRLTLEMLSERQSANSAAEPSPKAPGRATLRD